jgi:hypothetical protein
LDFVTSTPPVPRDLTRTGRTWAGQTTSHNETMT